MIKRIWIIGASAGLGLASVTALPLVAQEDGGLKLTFGFSARVESETNPGLTVPAEPSRSQISTRLSFGLQDSTRLGTLSLSAAGTLAAYSDDTENGLQDSDLRFALSKSSAASTVSVSAFYREIELDALRRLIIDPDSGQIFEDVTGDGTQRQTGGDVRYSFGEDAPWGGSVSAGLVDTSYFGDTTEVDNVRTDAALDFRFNLDPATEVTAGLGWSRYEDDLEPASDTLSPELGLRRDLPSGSAFASIFADNTDDGTRTGFLVGRSLDRPDRGLSFSIGLTRSIVGEVDVTGSVDWQRELANGSISVNVLREVISGSEDEETIVAGGSIGLSHNLSELAALNFGLNASSSKETATGILTRNASLSASYSRSIVDDWVLDAGVTHRIREEGDQGRANSDIAFLELRRSFDWRP
jgi:hypothetical protein